MLRFTHRVVVLATLLSLVVSACRGPVTQRTLTPSAATPTPAALAATPTPQAVTPTPTRPAAAPSVVSHAPSSRSVNTRRPTISLTFNREMDQASVAAALGVEPPIEFDLRWEKKTLYVDLLQPLEPGVNYLFTLAETATDTNGVALKDFYSWAVRPVKAIGAIDGPTPERPRAPLELAFNYPMDAASVESALAVEPGVAGAWSWTEGNTVATFTPEKRLTSNTTYILRFSGKLRDANGDEMSAPDPLTFTTPPAVTVLSPRGDPVHPMAPVRIAFDRPMNQAAVEAAFSIRPAVEGAFEWKDTTLTFTPERGYFDENTTYTVTLDAAVKDSDGAPVIDKDYTWSFATGKMGDVGSFGFGPNAQLVDADGRRAIQFSLVEPDVERVTFELYRLSLEQFLDRYSSSFRGVADPEKKPISLEGTTLAHSWLMDASRTPDNDTAIREVIIPPEAPPGMYILNLTAGHVNDQLIVLLTHHTLLVKQAEGRLMAWVTDVNGGAVGDARVGVYARDGQLLAQGHTDEAGVFRAAVSRDPAPLIVVAGNGDDVAASGLTGEWRTSGYYWDWWQSTPTTLKYAAYIYTDRPIYRPGQTMYFKAVIRRDDDAVLSVLSETSEVTVRIRDARNNVVQTMKLISNQFGAVNGEFIIAEGAMLGNYAVEVVFDSESHRQEFKVQDYRKPDYEVIVSTDATKYVAGDEIQVTVEARYFFGEPVPNADITISQYELGRDEYCWDYCPDTDIWLDIDRSAITGKTDANGRFTFTVDAAMGYYGRGLYGWADLKQSIIGIEATVDDGSHQAVSSFAAVKVYSAGEKIQMSTGGYLKTPGQPFEVRASAFTIFDQPVSGRSLTLQLRQWNSSRGDYTTVVHSFNLTTDANGLAALPVTVEKTGFYQAHLTARDRRGNEMTYDRWLYVFGKADRWTSSSDLRIAADRDSYAPGEDAALIIESSFSGPALLTFERGTTRREQLIELTAPLTRVEVPVQPDDAPNIFATVNAWKEQDTSIGAIIENDSYYYYLSRADSRLFTATVELHVPVTDKTLTVTVTPDKPAYSPRETATFTVRVTDWKGDPAAAEVSLALVDEAIFSLSDELSGPIFDSFYFERGNIVRTYNSMAPHRWLVGDEGGRGGGGGGGFSPGNPRSNFPDTAAWVPVLHTDWKGEAVVTFTLPDNLTSWRVTAKAVTTDTQVGETYVNVLTQQPIVVRPILPRALTAGDHVELSAIVHNYTGSSQKVAVSIEADRLTIDSAATQTITLRSGEQKIVGWAATAASAGEASVTVSAKTGEAGDAVRLTIPILPLAVPEVSTWIGEFSGEYSATIPIPEGALDVSAVRVELSRSIAGSLLTGLEYLTGFPYGCVEQTMSKALPNAVVGRAFHQLGVGNPSMQADLPPKINAGIQRLYGYQHNDGGWGWWYDDATDAYQTAWVVFGLSKTAEAGYEIDSGVIRRGVDWMSGHLKEMDVRTRAFALYSMAEAGYGDLDSTLALAKKPGDLDPFSQAAIALALRRLGAAAEAGKMLDTLAKSAVESNGRVYWPATNEDGHYHEKTMASTVRATALVLSAFVRINPNHRLEPGIVRFLMGERRMDGWGSTNETSFTILALTDHLLAKETATADTEYTVELNGSTIASGTLGRGEPAVTLAIPADPLRTGDNALRIRQSGGGQLYYVISSRVYVAQSEVEAKGEVKVAREYVDPETNKAITSVEAGQLVKVQVTVTMPGDAFYIVVEDKLPGGLEALNEGLNTTSHEASALDSYGSYYETLYHWREWGYNNKEIRADRVSFFVTEFGEGMRTFTYYARATRAGQFVAMPVEVWAMYDLSVWGRSGSSTFSVVEK